ncbi:MAG TPA: GGDEF domain-containing protein [Actinomycetota bacterium]|nr:GGDEF domain-containing protein [Actinomycetota bacterium]
MALAGAVMFASGGILTLIATRLPHPEGMASNTQVVTSSIAIAAGAMLALVGRWLPLSGFHVLLQFGNLLIALGIYAAGDVGVSRVYALLYLWGALYASYFFSRLIMLLHMSSGAISYAAVVWVRSENLEWLAEWFVMVGSFVVAGFVVNWMTHRIHSLARTDPLTSLANRRTLEQELVREIGRAERDQRPISVLLVDVDNLKSINDAHGHRAGDHLLKSAGSAWQERLRSGDLLARYGGDEFAAILPDCSLHDATIVAERLCAAISGGYSCSVGIALWDGNETSDDLLRRADRALYEAKRRGRNRVVAAPLAPLVPGVGAADPVVGM